MLHSAVKERQVFVGYMFHCYNPPCLRRTTSSRLYRPDVHELIQCYFAPAAYHTDRQLLTDMTERHITAQLYT